MAVYTAYGIRVVIQNTGDADSGSFFVEMNSAEQWVQAGLPVGQSVELHFTGTVPSGLYSASADSTNRVLELDEGNNLGSFLAPTPSPPPQCTSTPITVPGATP